MTTIFARVATALATLTPLPFAMGRMLMTSGDLPDQYLTYQLVTANPALHLEDREAARAYTIQVSIFSRAGLAVLPDVDGAMTAAGFTKGNWRELPQDAQSKHYHLAKDYHFYDEGDLP
jgi:hypothetical protein